MRSDPELVGGLRSLLGQLRMLSGWKPVAAGEERAERLREKPAQGECRSRGRRLPRAEDGFEEDEDALEHATRTTAGTLRWDAS